MIRISRWWQQITKPNGCCFGVQGSAHEAGLADWKGTSGGRALRALQVILMLGEVWEPQIPNLPAFPQPTDVTVGYGSTKSQIRRETTDSGQNLSPGWQRGQMWWSWPWGGWCHSWVEETVPIPASSGLQDPDNWMLFGYGSERVKGTGGQEQPTCLSLLFCVILLSQATKVTTAAAQSGEKRGGG